VNWKVAAGSACRVLQASAVAGPVINEGSMTRFSMPEEVFTWSVGAT
jgi:hypothetical protein